MRSQRTKQQDWAKPFKFVFSKTDFEDLETSEDTVVNITLKEPTVHKKQQIITPHIQTVKRVTDVKPFAKINPNYVRLASHLHVPRTNDYQLTEVDHVFIQTHREKFKLNNKIVLTTQFLKSVIIALQTKQGKDNVIPRSKINLIMYLQREFKELSKLSNYEQFTDMVYNYWRNRRQELKFPLFRPLWRPNQDQYNHLLAFKLRQKQKRSLRRSSRTSEQDILDQLTNQLSLALKVCERIQLREQFKQKQVEVQLNLFHNQLKSIFAPPQFLSEISPQTRSKDRQKIKKYNFEVERIRKERQIKNEQTKEPLPSIFDQKESVVNFLATVVAQAQLCGLSYEKLFHYKSQVHPTPVFTSLKQVPPIQQPSLQEQQQYLNLSLRRAGAYIMRQFQQESHMQEQSTQQSENQIEIANPIKRELEKIKVDDLFDFKKKKVCLYYFGDDDQGDYQNLRKNIATSFKKFQATKQIM